ncbi:MAG: glutathione S-transferase family protein [Arenicellales bacterium]
MSKIKLTYFDIDGGRAEPTRIIMSIGGIEFEDHRISFEEFSLMRGSTPFNAVPVIEMNDGVYTQSNAMNRYFGKQAGLYPENSWQAFLCDEIMDAVDDAMHFVARTFGLEGAELEAARRKLVDGALTTYLKTLNNRLEAAGGKYFADARLTVADLKVFVMVRGLRSGVLDHVPTDLVDRIAPLLSEHVERIAAEPGVVAYYKKRGKP